MKKRFSKVHIKHTDTYIAFSTGVLILILMIVMAYQSNSLYTKLNEEHHDRLAISLATTIGESIGKVSFSGQYQTRLLVEELSRASDYVAIISVENLDRQIIANSNPSRNGVYLTNEEWEENQKCILQNRPIISKKNIENQEVKVVLVPYRSGFDNEVQGVVRLVFNETTVYEGQKRIFSQIIQLILVVTTLLMLAVYLFSRYFGKKVHYLANHLEGILNNAPIGILVFDKVGLIHVASKKMTDFFRNSASATFAAELPDTNIDVNTRLQIQELLNNTDPRQTLEKELEIVRDGKVHFWQISKFPISTAAAQSALTCILFSDISERRIAEISLRQSEQKARAIFDQSFQFIGLLTPDGRLTEVNRTALEFGNFSPQEIINKPFWETPWWQHSAEEQNKLKLSIEKAAQGEHIRFETTHFDDKGNIHYMDYSLKPLKDENNRVVFLIPEGHDITNIRRAEETLRARERRFAQLVQNSFDTIVILDNMGIQRYVSGSTEKVHGYSTDELININVIDQMIHPDDKEQVVKAFQKIIETGQGGAQYRHKRKGGGWVHLEAFGTNQLNNPDIEGIVVNVRDISDRKQAEEALRISEHRFRSIIAVSNTGAWEYNLNTGYLWCSPEYFSMLGLNSNDFILDGSANLKETWTDLLHPEDRDKASEHFMEYLGGNSIGMYENYYRLRHRDGNWIWIWSRGQTLRDVNGEITNLTVGTHIDITKNRLAEEELINYKNNLELLVKKRTEELATANEELHSANEELFDKNEALNQTLRNLREAHSKLIEAEKMASLGTLTAGVAHEINNPLNFIMGAQLGFEEYFKIHESADKSITDFLQNSIRTGIERISGIVKGLSQFSRSNEQLDENCDIHSIIDNCLVILNNKIKHSAQVEKEYFNGQILVKGNVGKLHQVFLNILNNSVQAIKENGIIGIKTSISEKLVSIVITDNGVGIDEKILPKITEPFFTTKSPGEGTGLGLSITYSIVQDHKGSLEFESEVNKGTKAIITLPIK